MPGSVASHCVVAMTQMTTWQAAITSIQRSDRRSASERRSRSLRR